MLIKISDLRITPIPESIVHLNLTDEEYFSEKYSGYISNSKLKYINPEQDGSPQLFKEGIKHETNPSFQMGTAVHQLFLQPDDYELVEGLDKPTAKLGLVVERVKYYRDKNYTIHDSIYNSSQDVNYYAKTFNDDKLKNVIKKGIKYYINSKNLPSNSIVLSDKDTVTCKNCLASLLTNNRVQKAINPVNIFGEKYESNNEDVILMDIKVACNDWEIILPLKMKADNWVIDKDDETLMLNDLKTTSKPVPYFMKEYGSFIHYHYGRQMAMYLWMLQQYCMKEYGYTKEWKTFANMIVVETMSPFRSQCYNVNKLELRKGGIELFRLLKMVACYEKFGYEEEIEFI